VLRVGAFRPAQEDPAFALGGAAGGRRLARGPHAGQGTVG
jgi:hypothetical protein